METQEAGLDALLHVVEERWIVGERIFDRVAKQVDITMPTADQIRELLYQAAESGHHAPACLEEMFGWCRVVARQGYALVAPDTREVRDMTSILYPGYLEPRATDGGIAFFWPQNTGGESSSKLDAHRRYAFEEPEAKTDEEWERWGQAYDRYADRVADDISTVQEVAHPLQLALRGYFQVLFPGEDVGDRVERMIRSYYVLHAEGSVWTRALISAGRLLDRGVVPYCVLGKTPGSCVWMLPS